MIIDKYIVKLVFVMNYVLWDGINVVDFGLFMFFFLVGVSIVLVYVFIFNNKIIVIVNLFC